VVGLRLSPGPSGALRTTTKRGARRAGGVLTLSLLMMAVGLTLPVGASTATRDDRLATPTCGRQLATNQVNRLFRALGSGDSTRVASLFPSVASWSFHVTSNGEVLSASEGMRILPQPGAATTLSNGAQSGDTRAIAALFPPAGGWEFELAPTIDGFIATGRLSKTGLSATGRGGLAQLVAEFKGTKLSLVRPVGGRAVQPQTYTSPSGTVLVDEYDVGPLAWRAQGKRLRSKGVQTIGGSSKIVLYCKTGLFAHVALSPNNRNNIR
jgi:hypothetical protein